MHCPTTPGVAASETRDALLAALGSAPVTIDDLISATGICTGALRVALIELYLAGCLDHHGGQMVSLRVGAPD